jgi:hypothetical protein
MITAVGRPKATGLTRQQAALASIAAVVVVVRPMRSARPPATTAPRNPAIPIAANAITPIATRAGAPRDATRKAGSQDQSA